MAKKKEKLSPVADYVPPEPAAVLKVQAKAESATAPPPDLSYIIEDLRSCAVPIGEVDFLPRNPRLHKEKDLAALGANVQRWTQYRPVVVNIAKDPPQVVAGNGVLSVMLAAGRSHIARVRKHLTDEEAAALAVCDNETALLSCYDEEKLQESLKLAENLDADPRLKEMLAELVTTAKEPKKADAAPVLGGLRFQIMIECASEEEQVTLLERLEGEGLKCRPLML